MEPTPEPNPIPRYSLSYRPTAKGYSPYRLVDEIGNEISEANEFLHALAARGLSERSLRTYGYSLLNFWKWLSVENFDFHRLSEAELLSYIRFQQRSAKRVAAATINHRLSTVSCLYRYYTGRDIPSGSRVPRNRPFFLQTARRDNLSYGISSRHRRRAAQLRMKAPRPVVVPLSSEEVRKFLESLRSWRDLSIVALMLFCGLRSREVVGITLEDVRFLEGDLLVQGKGQKERVIPLTPEVISCLQAYLDVERPETTSPRLFVSLKGPQRAQPMTLAGLRSLFRYHRKCSRVSKANPHRFRHTFGADMARAGISLPALMRLMGHASIRTTMLYIELAPRDVWEEFHKVAAKLRRERLLSGEIDA